MSGSVWTQIHGATVHFPLALTVCAAACDFSGLLARSRRTAESLHCAAYWTIVLAACGGVFAVASGLVMTHGTMLGIDLVLRHHAFVWPAFTLLVGVATWRFLVGTDPGGTAAWLCALLELVSAGSMIVAGYFGGELAAAA